MPMASKGGGGNEKIAGLEIGIVANASSLAADLGAIQEQVDQFVKTERGRSIAINIRPNIQEAQFSSEALEKKIKGAISSRLRIPLGPKNFTVEDPLGLAESISKKVGTVHVKWDWGEGPGGAAPTTGAGGGGGGGGGGALPSGGGSTMLGTAAGGAVTSCGCGFNDANPQRFKAHFNGTRHKNWFAKSQTAATTGGGTAAVVPPTPVQTGAAAPRGAAAAPAMRSCACGWSGEARMEPLHKNWVQHRAWVDASKPDTSTPPPTPAQTVRASSARARAGTAPAAAAAATTPPAQKREAEVIANAATPVRRTTKFTAADEMDYAGRFPTANPAARPVAGKKIPTLEEIDLRIASFTKAGNKAVVDLYAHMRTQVAGSTGAPVRPRVEAGADEPKPIDEEKLAGLAEPAAAQHRAALDTRNARAKETHEKNAQPWTCTCGQTMRYGSRAAHLKTPTHTAQMKAKATRERRANRAATPASAPKATLADLAASVAPAAGAAGASLFDLLGGEQEEGSQPYTMPGYVAPQRRWLKFPDIKQILERKAAETGDPSLAHDLSGLYSEPTGSSRGRNMYGGGRSRRRTRGITNIERMPALQARRAALEWFRGELEAQQPMPEGEQIKESILQGGGSITPGAGGDIASSAVAFGKATPAEERAKIKSRLSYLSRHSLEAPTGHRAASRGGLTREDTRILTAALGRTPTLAEKRQHAIELGMDEDVQGRRERQGRRDAGESVTSPFDFDEYGIPRTVNRGFRGKVQDRPIDEKVRARRAGGRNQPELAVPTMAQIGLDPQDLRALQGIDLTGGFRETILPELHKLMEAGEFTQVLEAVGEEFKTLRAVNPRMMRAQQAGISFSEGDRAARPGSPAAQFEAQFLELTALAGTARNMLGSAELGQRNDTMFNNPGGIAPIELGARQAAERRETRRQGGTPAPLTKEMKRPSVGQELETPVGALVGTEQRLATLVAKADQRKATIKRLTARRSTLPSNAEQIELARAQEDEALLKELSGTVGGATGLVRRQRREQASRAAATTKREEAARAKREAAGAPVQFQTGGYNFAVPSPTKAEERALGVPTTSADLKAQSRLSTREPQTITDIQLLVNRNASLILEKLKFAQAAAEKSPTPRNLATVAGLTAQYPHMSAVAREVRAAEAERERALGPAGPGVGPFGFAARRGSRRGAAENAGQILEKAAQTEMQDLTASFGGDVAQTLRSELKAQIDSLEGSVGSARHRARAGASIPGALDLLRTRTELGLVERYFPESGSDPLAEAKRLKQMPKRSKIDREGHQAANLLLARAAADAPRETAAEIAARVNYQPSPGLRTGVCSRCGGNYTGSLAAHQRTEHPETIKPPRVRKPKAAVTQMSVADLEQYMEIDREKTPKLKSDPGYLDRLTEEIRKSGKMEPVGLDVDPQSGTALLGEGNHRLAVARRLGMTQVPVRLNETPGMPGKAPYPPAPQAAIGNVTRIRLRSGESREDAARRLHAAGMLNDNQVAQLAAQGIHLGAPGATTTATAAPPTSAGQQGTFGFGGQGSFGFGGTPASFGARGGGAATATRSRARGGAAAPPPGQPPPGQQGNFGFGGAGGGGGPNQPPQPPAAGSPLYKFRPLSVLQAEARGLGLPEEQIVPRGAQQGPNIRGLAARATAAEAVQLTPVRALSVAFGQYAATLGARGGVRARQLVFEKEQALADTYDADNKSHLASLKQLAQNRKSIAKGTEAYDLNREETQRHAAALKVGTKRFMAQQGAAEVASKAVSTFGTQMANLALGTAGIVSGTIVFAATMQIAQAAMAALAPVAAEGIDRLTGFAATTNKVTSAIAEQGKATGLYTKATYEALSQAGIGGALGAGIAPGIAGRAAALAASERAGAATDVVNTALNVAEGKKKYGGFDAALFETNAGLFGTALGSPNKPIQERIGNEFERTGQNDFGRLLGATPLGALQPSRAAFEMTRQMFQDALDKGAASRGEMQGARYVEPTDRFNPGAISARSQQATMLDAAGAPEMAAAVRSGSLEIRDASGQLVMGLKELRQAVADTAKGFEMPDLGSMVKAMQERAIPILKFQLERGLQNQTQLFQPASRALGRVTTPPRPYGVGLVGQQGEIAGLPQANITAMEKYQGVVSGVQGTLDKLRKADFSALGKMKYVNMDDVRMIGVYGQKIQDIQIGLADEQLAVSAAQYNNQLRIASRSLAEIKGLTDSGSKSEQSRVGQMERANLLLEREMTILSRRSQRLSLDQSQRQINFNRAVAGFTASGATPAEAAAQLEQGKKEADFAQTQLDIQNQIFDKSGQINQNQIQIVDQQNLNQLQDVLAEIGLLQQGYQLQVDTTAGEAAIGKINEAQQALVDTVQAQVGTSEGWVSAQTDFITQVFTESGAMLNDVVTAVDKAFNDSATNFATAFDPLFGTGGVFGGGSDTSGGVYGIGGGGGGGLKKAEGDLGTFSAPTNITVGEAGSETVAIIRNPRNFLAPGGSGSPSQVTVNLNFNGEVNVRDDKDIQTIAHAVEKLFNRRASLVGLR